MIMETFAKLVLFVTRSWKRLQSLLFEVYLVVHFSEIYGLDYVVANFL